MFTLTFRLTAAVTFVLLAAPVAWAQPCISPGIPCPATSSFPPCVMLLPGPSDTYNDPLTAFYQPFNVTVEDGGGFFLPGVRVTLDFTLPADLTIASVQDPAYVFACGIGAPKAITTTTNAVGVARFIVRGAGRNSLPGGGIGPGAFGEIRVLADGGPFGPVALGNVTATVPDENGAGLGGVVVNGLDPGDAAFFRYDLFNFPATAGRSDFSCNGMVDPVDGAILRDYLFNDLVSGAPQFTPYCP